MSRGRYNRTQVTVQSTARPERQDTDQGLMMGGTPAGRYPSNPTLNEGMHGAWRGQGQYTVPALQHKLDKAVLGQVFHCPCCGHAAAAPLSAVWDCVCGSKWVLSWGVDVDTEDVVVVRCDRWK